MIKVQPSVLLVEDDGEMRSLLRDGLRTEGYVFREAEDGERAVLSVLRAAPDLIITEVRLSAGGFGYVARLRAVVPHCPIIVLTAFGDERVRSDVLRAGATVYMSKPVHLSELRAYVDRLLDAGRRTVAQIGASTESVF